MGTMVQTFSITRTVSSRVSPFTAEEVEEFKGRTEPPNRSIAAVNDEKVLVDGSKARAPITYCEPERS